MTDEQAAFKAGWDAAQEFEHHEWGPQPPATAEDAYVLWKNTCANGHHTFKANTPKCPECRQLRKRGEYAARSDT